MAQFGCPHKLIALGLSFHNGMQVRVQYDESPEPILVTNGVKQGCALAPALFSIIFSAMLADAFKDDSSGIDILYRSDRKLLNLRRLKAKSKANGYCVQDKLFAHDCSQRWVWAGDAMQHG